MSSGLTLLQIGHFTLGEADCGRHLLPPLLLHLLHLLLLSPSLLLLCLSALLLSPLPFYRPARGALCLSPLSLEPGGGQPLYLLLTERRPAGHRLRSAAGQRSQRAVATDASSVHRQDIVARLWFVHADQRVTSPLLTGVLWKGEGGRGRSERGDYSGIWGRGMTGCTDQKRGKQT